MSKELTTQEIDERTRNQVMRHLGTKTIRQISEAVGVPVETVLRVKQDVVDSMDALTIEEHVAKAFMDLQNVVNTAMAEFNSTDDARSKAPLLSAAVTATKTTMQMLEKWDSKNSDKVDTLNRKRQSELIKVVSRTNELTAEALDDGLPHDREEILSVMMASLLTAAGEMEARNG